jgi:hypothetical protein
MEHCGGGDLNRYLKQVREEGRVLSEEEVMNKLVQVRGQMRRGECIWKLDGVLVEEALR